MYAECITHSQGITHLPTFLLHPVWFAKTVLMSNDSLTLAKLDSKSTFNRVISGTTLLLEGVGSSYSESSYSDSVVVFSDDWCCFALSVVSLVLHGGRLKQFPWSLLFLVVRKITCMQHLARCQGIRTTIWSSAYSVNFCGGNMKIHACTLTVL